MFKLLLLSVLIMAACAMPKARVQRSPHRHHHRGGLGGLGFSGSIAHAESSAVGFGGGHPAGFGGYEEHPVGYGGYHGGHGGYDGYPRGHGGYHGGHDGYRGNPGFGGGFSDASAHASSFGVGFDFKR